ncbi:hypothetical protein ACH5RR_022393 [Cinchona calisaya]|uniref:Carbonic anhydrase n=1 Tax=Cinchona calisaya TaxID=153742 RepID=A0ABD2Z7P0_9GENT
MALSVPQSTPSCTSSNLHSTSPRTFRIFGSQLRFLETKQTHVRLLDSVKSNSALRVKASREPQGVTREIINNEQKCTQVMENESDLFSEMKHRFLTFKKDKYLKNLEHFQNLAKVQTPKFLVIACADSRVCPSSILGFQPGEAFIVRNIANLVPPYENEPSETHAALEFSVNSLGVENILVVGHSCCGGIRALMSMEDNQSSSFITNWVRIGKSAKLSTKATASASNLNFDQQCRHCEKVSINQSMLNLLTYPWIEEKVAKGKLSVHGGYYDFVDCAFEKWTLDYKGSESKGDGEYSITNHEFWS